MQGEIPCLTGVKHYYEVSDTAGGNIAAKLIRSLSQPDYF